MTLLALVFVGLVPMAPAQAASTISISQGTVIGGESVSVTGKLGQRKARRVILQRKVAKRWVNVTPSRSTRAGAFRFYFRPSTKAGTRTVVRVVAPPAKIGRKKYSRIISRSRTVNTVGQTAAISAPPVVSQGALFNVSGTFRPVRTGRTAVLQQLSNGSWSEIKRGYQNSAGRVNFTTRLTSQGSAGFRVVGLAANGAPAVYSAADSVDVSMPVPANLRATPADGQVQLSWSPVAADGLSGYNVYRRIDEGDLAAGWEKTTPSPITSTTFTAGALTNGRKYYFTVTSVKVSGDRSAFAPKVSAIPVALPDTSSPAVPAGVVAAPGNASAQLSWNPVADPDLAGYHVYRRTPPAADWSKLTLSPIATTSFAATSLSNGTTYEFAVASVDASGNQSVRSTPVAVTPAPGADQTPPPVPTGAAATAGSASAQLTWAAVAAGDLAGYKVYRRTAAAPDWVSLTPTAVSSVTFNATGLTNGTQYFFAVTSLDTSGNESAKSVAAAATPTAPPASWAAVSAGSQHTCAVGANGTLWCWGLNRHGQLGTSTGVDTGNAYGTPTRVGSADDWTSVSAGDDFTCGLRSAGTLWCWGVNKYGQIGSSANAGTQAANPTPTQVGSASTWTSLSAGGNAACGIQSSGTLWCWGLNLDGQLGRAANVNTTTPNPAPEQVGSVSTWASVTAGTGQTCGTRTNGTLWCWGSNLYGQLGNNSATVGTFTPTTTPTQVGSATTWSNASAGDLHTCAVQSTGAAYCWGANGFGELGNATGAGADDTHPTPLAVSGSGFATIETGKDHTCATKTDATVFCWGRNASGQLGKTANTSVNAVPSKVGAAANWSSIQAGGSSTCARNAQGEIFCWGYNEFGQLGNAATVGTGPNSTPTKVAVPAV